MIRSALARLLPRRLSTQLILVAVLALVTAQVLAFVLYSQARLASVSNAMQESTTARTASIAQLLVHARPGLRRAVLDSVRSRVFTLELAADPAELPPTPTLPPSPALRKQLIEAAPDAIRNAQVFAAPQPARSQPIIVVYAQLADNQHLYVKFKLPGSSGNWATSVLVSATALSLLLALAMALLLRRLTRPLARLSAAAESLGRGREPGPLPEEGPDDVIGPIRAFNRMQVRIRDYNEERTRTLASVSHDLRTPITALRLQIEFVDDPEQRDSMLATVAEMEAVTQAALDYLKNSRSTEAARLVDIAALVDSACEELRLTGLAVEHEYAGRISLSCRPSLMKRAISNLVRNAAVYGERARVSVTAAAEEVVIRIDDDGPGIPPERMDDVRRPFVRLEDSRSRDTGGSGLGLAIAHEVIAGHGGRLLFENRPEGGLRQDVLLPMAADELAALSAA